MFTYYHCYLPQTWQAQINAGLIDETSGIRMMQSSLAKPEKGFNVVAAKGGAFDRMLRELRLPLYIDRLQGGCFYDGYQFDKQLITHYQALLGDSFKGFQMHEWVTNLHTDIVRIKDCLKGPWTEQAITEALLKKHPYSQVYLEAESAAEHAAHGAPEDFDGFFELVKALFQKRMQQTDGLLIPCDSYGLAFKLELDAGIRMFMPEIGAQIPDTRLQIAYARGMARTNHRSFGIYYEPWGGDPFSACCYHREGTNEWGLDEASDFPFITCGENGGSSRSLQKRLHLYGYFAGAEFMSEEWGMCNTFYDWKDFELSPYGKIKYDFLQLVKKYPKSEIGTPYTPIAIVLPKDLPVVASIGQPEDNTIFGYALSDSLAHKMRTVRAGLKALLSSPSEPSDFEARIMINSHIPDAFDVIHEDRTDYGDYQYYVDLTSDEAFHKSHRCCSVEDAPALLEKLLPCHVEGGVHWFVNRTKDGRLLIIFNHSGIMRSVAEGEHLMPEATKQVSICLKDGASLRPLEGGDDLSLENGTYRLTLGAGEWFLGKF